MNQKQQLQELVRHIVRQTLKELLGTSTYQSTSFGQQPTTGVDPNQPPEDAMTPYEKAKQEREQEKQRRVALKQGEQELKTAKKQQDFYTQNVNQSKRFTIPTLTKKLQALKGGTFSSTGTSSGL